MNIDEQIAELVHNLQIDGFHKEAALIKRQQAQIERLEGENERSRTCVETAEMFKDSNLALAALQENKALKAQIERLEGGKVSVEDVMIVMMQGLVVHGEGDGEWEIPDEVRPTAQAIHDLYNNKTKEN